MAQGCKTTKLRTDSASVALPEGPFAVKREVPRCTARRARSIVSGPGRHPSGHEIGREIWLAAQKCIHPRTAGCHTALHTGAVPSVLGKSVTQKGRRRFSRGLPWHRPEGVWTCCSATCAGNYGTKTCAEGAKENVGWIEGGSGTPPLPRTGAELSSGALVRVWRCNPPRHKGMLLHPRAVRPHGPVFKSAHSRTVWTLLQ